MAFHKQQDRELATLTDEISAFDAFRGLARKSIEAIARTGRVVHLPTSWALISEDTPADSVYVLLDGRTEVRHDGEVIAQLGSGALVGEAALVDRRRRNATVVTTDPVRALRLSYDDLPVLFDKHADVEDLFRREWEKKAAGAAPV